MRGGRVALAVLALAPGCTGNGTDAARRAEVARRVAEAEGASGEAEGGSGAAAAPAPRVPVGITREAASPPGPEVDPPTAAELAWAEAIAGSTDALDQRSRQLLSVQRLRGARDPRQKSQDLIAHMQWCDEGTIEACLHVGHVLLFNECLFDRARGFYQKAEALAGALPPAAVDSFTVDGTPQRQELRIGLKMSDPLARDDDQVRGVAAVCGAIAERDRLLWDEMFARYAAGEATPAATPATGEERLALGAMRSRMFIDLVERIAAIERQNAGLAPALKRRLATAADGLCGDDDPLTCATASFLHAHRCDFEKMKEAHQRFEAAIRAWTPRSAHRRWGGTGDAGAGTRIRQRRRAAARPLAQVVRSSLNAHAAGAYTVALRAAPRRAECWRFRCALHFVPRSHRA